jgi:WD40 repeat protein
MSSHKSQINALEVYAKDNLIVTGSLDEARVYDMRTGHVTEKLNTGPVNCIGYSPQYHKVIVAAANQKIYVRLKKRRTHL